MAIKSDRWIRRMALEHGMIEPFEDRQVRAGVVSYGLSSYGYDMRVADEFKVFTTSTTRWSIPRTSTRKSFVDIKAAELHRAAQLVRAGPHHRVLPHPARRADGLPRQVDLRALRHHRQRHAVRARVGRPRHASRSRTRRRCRRRSTPTRASRRCCSSRATSRARCRTRTRRASTRRSAASRCPRSDGPGFRALDSPGHRRRTDDDTDSQRHGTDGRRDGVRGSTPPRSSATSTSAPSRRCG